MGTLTCQRRRSLSSHGDAPSMQQHSKNLVARAANERSMMAFFFSLLFSLPRQSITMVGVLHEPLSRASILSTYLLILHHRPGMCNQDAAVLLGCFSDYLFRPLHYCDWRCRLQPGARLYIETTGGCSIRGCIVSRDRRANQGDIDLMGPSRLWLPLDTQMGSSPCVVAEWYRGLLGQIGQCRFDANSRL